MNTATVVTCCDRPAALKRSLPQITALGVPVLVVDDSRDPQNARVHEDFVLNETGGAYLRLPYNRGLAGALNIGLAYWLADPTIRWISYFQDDVDVDPLLLGAMALVTTTRPFATGHHAPEHGIVTTTVVQGIRVHLKGACRATHMHASVDYWAGVMPIPARELGAPKRVPGDVRGLGSNVDWWVVNWAPKSVVKQGGYIPCVPGLVRSFLWRKEDSCWNNEQKAGEEPPLSRDAIPGLVAQ